LRGGGKVPAGINAGREVKNSQDQRFITHPFRGKRSGNYSRSIKKPEDKEKKDSSLKDQRKKE